MANLTLNGWKTSVATGVVEALPLQDFESALVLADDFLATQGGWNPDDAGDPTGPGVPVSGATLEEAIVLITDQNLDRVYHVDVSGNMNFRILMNEKLATGLSDEDVLTNITDRLSDVVELNLGRTSIELVDIPSFTGDVTSGPTTATQRLNIQNTIEGGGRIIDPRAIGLVSARATFNLDTTWNVEFLYTEPDKSLYLSIIKYTTDLYQTVDSNVDNTFGIYMNPITYRTTGGVVVPVASA